MANSDNVVAGALDPSAAVQAYFNVRLGRAADLIGYIAPQGWIRFWSIALTCILPTALSIGMLPTFAGYHIAYLGTVLPRYLLFGGYAAMIGHKYAHYFARRDADLKAANQRDNSTDEPRLFPINLLSAVPPPILQGRGRPERRP